MVKQKNTRQSDLAPRSSSKAATSMRSTMSRHARADDPMVHLTIQVPASMRDRIRDAAKDDNLSVRIWLTALLERKLRHYVKKR